MITPSIKIKVEQIVHVFETSSIKGKYDALVVLKDGENSARQITYGRSQTTEQGNLKTLLNMYITRSGIFGNDFKPFLPKLGKFPLDKKAWIKTYIKTRNGWLPMKK